MKLLHLQQPTGSQRGPGSSKKVLEVQVDGPIGRLFSKYDWAASTIPLPYLVIILYWYQPDPLTRVHEFTHVQQDQGNPCFLVSWVKYLYEMVKERLHTSSWYQAYLANRYEVAAYKVEGDVYNGIASMPAWAKAS